MLNSCASEETGLSKSSLREDLVKKVSNYNSPKPKTLIQLQKGREVYWKEEVSGNPYIKQNFWIRIFGKRGGLLYEVVASHRDLPSLQYNISTKLIKFLNEKIEQEIYAQFALGTLNGALTLFLENLIEGNEGRYYDCLSTEPIPETSPGTLLIITFNKFKQRFVGELYIDLFQTKLEI